MVARYRAAVYRILNPIEEHTRAGRVFEISILALIALNVIAVVIETIQAVELRFKAALWDFEVFSVVVFTVEYLLRLWTCTVNPRFQKPVVGRIRYAFTYLALIDLIAILPFYLPVLLPFDLRFMRGIRLFRLLRLFKIGRYSHAMSTIASVLRAKKGELGITILVVFVFLLLASSLMYEIERDAQPNLFPNIPSALWWGVVTLTTVGYGDVYPVTGLGKVIGSIIALVGIALFALPAGIIASGFIEHQQSSNNRRLTCPHCGKEISGP